MFAFYPQHLDLSKVVVGPGCLVRGSPPGGATEPLHLPSSWQYIPTRVAVTEIGRCV